ncbi:ion channel [Candidatus Omnitrophota bacterium]
MKGKGKFFYLLASLLFILFAYPIFERSFWAGKILALFFTGVLVAGVYVVSGESRIKFKISLILAIPTVIFLWTDQFLPIDFAWDLIADVVSYTLLVLFTFFTAISVLLYVIKAKKVVADVLAGAACVYLLFGLSWGMLYALLERVTPGSFIFGEAIKMGTLLDWPVFNYYSFTTLTTLGYGDITPVSSRAQSFAILEAITGVLFTALLVARLVGMYLFQLREREE